VTTHDVELQESLSGQFELYHFLENPDIEGYFDFQLRRGATAERNAIRLLGRLGFPDEVVEKALSYSRSNHK
jgi:DNA mismatch repair ATPase MutS